MCSLEVEAGLAGRYLLSGSKTSLGFDDFVGLSTSSYSFVAPIGNNMGPIQVFEEHCTHISISMDYSRICKLSLRVDTPVLLASSLLFVLIQVLFGNQHV